MVAIPGHILLNIYNGSNLTESLLFALSITLSIWYAQYHWKRRRLYKMAAQRPGPPTLPIIGNALYFSKSDVLKSVLKLSSEYDLPARAWLGGELCFVIADPEDLEIILNSPHALDKGSLYKYIATLLGNSIFTAPVSKWKRHRKIIMPTFNQKVINGLVEVFSKQSAILVEDLKRESGRKMFNIFPYLSDCAVNTISESVLGVNVNAQTRDFDFLKWVNRAMEILFQRMFVLWYHLDCIFKLTSMAKEQEHVIGTVYDFTRAIVKRNRENYRIQPSDNIHFGPEEPLSKGMFSKRRAQLKEIIRLSAEEAIFTDEELQEELTTIMIAGSDTTAATCSFVLMMLGMFPDVQRKIYDEIVDVLGTDRPVECGDLPKLLYTERVIKETMRFFPAGPFVSRKITGDIKLEKCIIPKGCTVLLIIMHLHRNANVWPDPLKFDPDRFLPEQIAKRHPYSWLPFSGGPRNCIAPKFAMMDMKVVIAMVVRKFQITTDYKSIEDIKVRADLTLKPVDGFRTAIKLRQ